MMYNIRSLVGFLFTFIATIQMIEEVMAAKLSGCNVALGMQSRDIKNSQIRASSSLDPRLTPPHFGRLHNTGSFPTTLGAWCSKTEDLYQYLLIDLQSVKNITGISSQGLKFSGSNWVSSYSVSYSCDGKLWIAYVIGGHPMIFSGNDDTDAVKRNTLPIPIVARIIRIHPITWNRNNLICMRVEVHGCQSNQVCLPTALPTTALPSTRLRDTPTQNITTTSLVATTTKETTQAAPTTPSCTSSLGMEDNRIKDSQITASSHRNNFRPSAGRLNNSFQTSISFGAWCAQATNTDQYLQVDLLRPTAIVAIATQGMKEPQGNWVTRYTLSYSCNGSDWFFYGNKRERTVEFKANTDSDSTVKYDLPTPLITRYVRLRPLEWNHYGNICLRMELYGCIASSQVCSSGNISDSITPTTRATQKGHTIEPSLTTPIIHSGVTDTKHDGSKPTNRMKATKHKKRIVIIYKKIEDDATTSRASQNSNNRLVTTLTLLFLLLRLA